MKNMRGAVVSKKASATGKRACNRSQAWSQVDKAAREELKVTGFVALVSVTYPALVSACAKAALPKALRKA